MKTLANDAETSLFKVIHPYTQMLFLNNHSDAGLLI